MHPFLQITRCVENVPRLKLYLKKQKWATNETLTYFKIRGVDNWMKVIFNDESRIFWFSTRAYVFFFYSACIISISSCRDRNAEENNQQPRRATLKEKRCKKKKNRNRPYSINHVQTFSCSCCDRACLPCISLVRHKL